MTTHGSGWGYGRWIFTALIAANLIACGGGGGGGSGTGGTGASSGSGGTGGGGTGGAGGSGNAGNCPVNPTFQGQPGTLWVQQKTDLASFDTTDGKLGKTLPAPGFNLRLSAGLGLLWLHNMDNDSDVTPFDPKTGTASPKLGVDASDLLAPGAGMLWTTASDASNNVDTYAISSPSSVKSFIVNFDILAYAATDDGLYFIGGELPNLADIKIVHVDAANSTIVWKLTSTEIPALADWATATGTSSMIVVGGKLFVKGLSAPNDKMFVVDLATKTQLIAADLGLTPDTNQMGILMTDGTGLYTIGEGNVYEVDQATLGAKRTHSIKPGGDDVIDSIEVQPAAGAIWLERRCGGKFYIQRLDTATFTTADIAMPNFDDTLGKLAAYLPP